MTRINLGLAALACAALLLAGCGGSSSSPGVAHLSSSTSGGSGTSGAGTSTSESRASTQQKLVAYSQCMRSHGEPEFPEPNSEGDLQIHSSDHNGHVTGINPESSQFQAAQKACAKLHPQGKAPSAAEQTKIQDQLLKFAECMRSHGVPNFPDPEFHSSGGAVRIKIGGKGGPGGIEPNSPQFKAAQKTCQSLMPGPKGGPGGPVPAGEGPTSGGGGGGGSESGSNQVVAP